MRLFWDGFKSSFYFYGKMANFRVVMVLLWILVGGLSGVLFKGYYGIITEF